MKALFRKRELTDNVGGFGLLSSKKNDISCEGVPISVALSSVLYMLIQVGANVDGVWSSLSSVRGETKG